MQIADTCIGRRSPRAPQHNEPPHTRRGSSSVNPANSPRSATSPRTPCIDSHAQGTDRRRPTQQNCEDRSVYYQHHRKHRLPRPSTSSPPQDPRFRRTRGGDTSSSSTDGKPPTSDSTCDARSLAVTSVYVTRMILPQVHLRKPCYDFSFL